MKKKFIISSILATLLLLFFVFKGTTFDVHITKADIEKAISKKIPHEDGIPGVLSFKIDSTSIILNEGSDRITASAVTKLLVDKQEYKGFIRISTGFSYDNENSTFYLHQPVLDTISMYGIPDRYTTMASDASKQIMQYVFEGIPVYQLKEKSFMQSIAKSTLKDLKIQNGEIIAKLGY